jgi:NAD(P)-dependent dehydrogenase (short-subunit alcohol dehydrogenase family)
MRFTDKVCLVTGAASGIGAATARRFGTEGGQVLLVDVDDAGGEQIAHDIVQQGGRAFFARADVSNSADVQQAITAATSRWHALDVVVNDAAMMTFQPIANLPDDDWDRVFAVNLRSVFLFCKYALPHMRPGGAFVNISSVHAHETTRSVVPYAASKGAMEAFTRGFSEEIAPKRLRVNCVAPGAVDTPMLWNNPNVKSGAEKVTGAIGQPEDIAAAVCFLASSDARFITGTTLVVDGGRLDLL